MPFEVGPNLYAALRTLHRRKKSRVVWADAICINKSDVGQKAYKVPLMGRLYTEATRAANWLGETNADIDALASWLNVQGPDQKLFSGQSST